MTSTDVPWLSLLFPALFGMLLFLRLRFPNASRRSETVVLVAAIVLFFSICGSLANPQESSSQAAGEITQAQVSR